MNLYGWDTAFAIDLAVANRALALSGESVLGGFTIDDPDGLGVKAVGSFGPWQIAEGGSGQFVTLAIPISDGWFEQRGQERVELAGITFIASVALDLIGSDRPEVEDLRFDVRAAGRVGDQPQPGVLTPIRIDDPDHRLNPIAEALFIAALTEDITRNANHISYVFATVNLVPPAADSWLAPRRSAFAYADRADGSGGALVILSVTTDRDIDGLPLSVDPSLLASGYEAAYGFSQALLLEHVVMPSLPEAFGHGATASAFTFDQSAGEIVNTRPLTLGTVTKGLIDYHPKVRTVRLGIRGSDLRARYDGWCDLKAGISMTFWIEPVNPITYDGGTTSLLFLSDDDPAYDYDADIPWYWWLGGLVVRAIVAIVVPAIASGVAESITKSVGAMLSPARRPPTSIQWEDTGDLRIATAWVADDFVMAGEFTRS